MNTTELWQTSKLYLYPGFHSLPVTPQSKRHIVLALHSENRCIDDVYHKAIIALQYHI